MHRNNAQVFYMTGAVSLDTTRNTLDNRLAGVRHTMIASMAHLQ